MFHGLAILIILLSLSICFEIKKWLVKTKLRNFQSPRQIPFIGVAARFLGTHNDDVIEVILEIFKEVKTTPFHAWLGPILLIGVSEPQDIEIILTSENCLDKPFFYEYLHCDTSIIVVPKETWVRDRRALNPSFNTKMLQSFVKPLNEKSRILIDKLKPYLIETGNVYRSIFICMMDMIARTTMGNEQNFQIEERRGIFFYEITKQLMNNIQYRIPRIWLRWNFVYKYLSKVGRDERQPFQDSAQMLEEGYQNIAFKVERLKSQGIDYLKRIKENNTMNVLEKCMLLEREGLFDHGNIIDQMRVVTTAGIDTSSITVFGTLLMLAINQKHQDLVIDELRSIFETADCDVTHEHLIEMKYTERVIRETMRLIPPVPFIGRKPSSDIELPTGTVPKGAMIVINIMHLHRNPSIWGENVLEFDPDRFLPENIAKRPRFSYVPFSGGRRNCIGMKYAMNSAKIVLAHLLRQYKFTTHLRFEEIRLNTHLVTEVVNENPLRIEKRDF